MALFKGTQIKKMLDHVAAGNMPPFLFYKIFF